MEKSRRTDAGATGAVEVNILMYHSVSDGPAPLCVSAKTFRRQMELLSSLGLRGVSTAHIREQGIDDPEVVVLTFDDGYKDMLTVVAPELEKRGWSATVFLACRLVDQGRADFAPWAELLSWSDAEQLVRAGWEVGSHTLTHPDLTKLDESSLEKEVGESRLELEQRLGQSVESFAAPSGRTNERVQECIQRHYALAVTTELAVAGKRHELWALPRLEMHYFQSLKRFEAQMRGQGDTYLGWRRTLRRMKQTLERSR